MQSSKILETHSIHDILKFITFDSWLFLDLDNTVIEATTELGSDQWFTKLIEVACKTIIDQEEAVNLVIRVYQAVQHHIITKPVDNNVVKLIRALQDIGVPVIALTARDTSLIHTTMRQLHENGIDFSKNRSTEEDHIVLGNYKDQAAFHRGIIFCSGNDKGKCLKDFLTKCATLPKNAVMVDDKPKHLTHVQAALESFGIHFQGLRYGVLDEKVKQLDFQQAHVQLAHLHPKLPDHTQSMIQRLQILGEHKHPADEKLSQAFAEPVKTFKRKREEFEEQHEDKEAKQEFKRSPSALSFFKHKRRKLEPKVQEPAVKMGLG